MDIIKRHYLEKMASYLKPNKVLVIYGPRQVGKTTLVNQFLDRLPRSTKIYKSAGENLELKTVLESSEFSKIIPFFQDYDLIVIDEAQKVSNIGQGLKIIVDQIPGKKIIATGSSSFHLSAKIGEPLVGRQNILTLFPIAVMELQKMYGNAYVFENLENNTIKPFSSLKNLWFVPIRP